MAGVILKKGRDESLRRYHPWIFSGAVASVEGDPYEGEAVEVRAADGTFLAVGHWQKGSIAVRVLSFDDRFLPDADGLMPQGFWDLRIGRAFQMRRALGLPSADTDCCRLVHGEGDSLPGLIVDVYGEVAVMQAHSAGMYLSSERVAQRALLPIAPDWTFMTATSRTRMPLTNWWSRKTATVSVSTGRPARKQGSSWTRGTTVSWWDTSPQGAECSISSAIREDSRSMPWTAELHP